MVLMFAWYVDVEIVEALLPEPLPLHLSINPPIKQPNLSMRQMCLSVHGAAEKHTRGCHSWLVVSLTFWWFSHLCIYKWLVGWQPRIFFSLGWWRTTNQIRKTPRSWVFHVWRWAYLEMIWTGERHEQLLALAGSWYLLCTIPDSPAAVNFHFFWLLDGCFWKSGYPQIISP